MIDCIVIHKNKENSTCGEGAFERMRKRRETSEAKIAYKSNNDCWTTSKIWKLIAVKKRLWLCEGEG